MVTIFAGKSDDNFTENDTDKKNDTNNFMENDTDKKNDTNSRLAKIFYAIKGDNKITTKQLAKLCAVSQSTIKRDIEKLKKQNKIERAGSQKAGYWKILVNS